MDLRRSATSSSLPAGAFAIPAARRSFQALKGRRGDGGFSLSRPFDGRSATQLRHLLAVTQGALVVVGVYVLMGAGIGLAAGALLIGTAAGLFAGLCAVAAILLIRGSAVAAGTATDHEFDERIPVGSLR